MSYLGFLDKDTLFSLLVRLHYEDLVALCKVKNYLWKIVCTEGFQEAWVSYNIRTVHISKNRTKEVDRLNRQHGRDLYYNYKGEIVHDIPYVQGKINGICKYTDQDKTITSPVTDGVQHGLVTFEYAGGNVEKYSHIRGLWEGLQWHFQGNCRILKQYRNGGLNGYFYEWYSDGARKSMCNYVNNIPCGRNICWWPNGKMRLDYNVVGRKVQGLHREWDVNGNLIKSVVYPK